MRDSKEKKNLDPAKSNDTMDKMFSKDGIIIIVLIAILIKLVFYNFELALTLTTLVAGIIWLLDILVLRKRRFQNAVVERDKKESEKIVLKQDAGVNVQDPWPVEYAKAFFPVLILVLLLRSFVAEPFRIPSGSMLPTLEVGDFILVNKFKYGLRLPVLRNKVTQGSEPERGDVVVFKFPGDPRIDYIKRIVGLPGDEIVYKDKQLYINGEQMDLEFIGDYNRRTERAGPGTFKVLHETLGKHEHEILNDPRIYSQDFYVKVEPGNFFVMGDNRDGSSDSRVWGFLPEKNLVGKAFIIWMHYDHSRKGERFDFSRVGKSIP